MLIMVRFVARRFAADVTGERPRAAMDLHMFGEVVASVERLTALRDFADVFFCHLMLANVPLTVVFPDELAAAVVAGVRADRLVGVHVRDVLGLADEGALAERALEGLGGAGHVRPAVQLEVPLGGEGLVADDAQVGPLAAVREQVRAEVCSEVHLRSTKKHFKIIKAHGF